MKKFGRYFLGFFLFFLFFSCKKQHQEENRQVLESELIAYAQGFTIKDYEDFYVVQIKQPWAHAKEHFSYVLIKKQVQLPDSLRAYPQIKIPIQSIVCTSTTHIPALDVLNEVASLKGFAGLDYVSSETVRKQIEQGKIKEVGQNEALNVEQILDIQPTVFMAFAMDNGNKSLHTLAQAGIPILYNGDWTEQHPLGKAEWIKLFGVLYNKEEEATRYFNQIAADYTATLQLVEEVQDKPTVLSGVMYADTWYLPEGNSWAGVYFKDAKTTYLWEETTGTGSLALSFEKVVEKAQEATYWINPGHYESLSDLAAANPHYKQFTAFKNKNIYSFAPTKGATGGALFYELGPLRPDLVLKDLIQIFHPEKLPDYQPCFYKKLE